MEINAGAIVEHAVRRQNVNISELSRRMHVNRRTLYNWFQQKKLDTDIIRRIGQVIDYDFSGDLQEDFNRSVFNDKASSAVPNTAKQSTSPDSVYYWMEKYIALLEDYKRLLRLLENGNSADRDKIRN